MKISIHSKSYFPIPTIINGKQEVIPPKGGGVLVREVKEIYNHLKTLEQRNFIKIVEEK